MQETCSSCNLFSKVLPKTFISWKQLLNASLMLSRPLLPQARPKFTVKLCPQETCVTATTILHWKLLSITFVHYCCEKLNMQCKQQSIADWLGKNLKGDFSLSKRCSMEVCFYMIWSDSSHIGNSERHTCCGSAECGTRPECGMWLPRDPPNIQDA